MARLSFGAPLRPGSEFARGRRLLSLLDSSNDMEYLRLNDQCDVSMRALETIIASLVAEEYVKVLMIWDSINGHSDAE